MLCSRKIPVAKNYMDKRGGYQEFPTEIFLSDNADNSRKGTLLCCVSEPFQERKSLRIRGGIKILRRKNFVLQGQKYP